MLFDKIIFGPIKSRRLGTSLGVNLLPTDAKICTFDCIYCECGFNFSHQNAKFPSQEEVYKALEDRLKAMSNEGEQLDVITFAGNGEPTIHPRFAEIIQDTLSLRDKYFPETKVSVLSNSTMLHSEPVMEALKRVDNNILKLDSGICSTIWLINQPTSPKFNLNTLVEQLQKFKGNVIIQTLFFKGEYMGKLFDNSSEDEVDSWLKIIEKVMPKQVMIYTLDRETPVKHLQKVDKKRMEEIATLIKEMGIDTSVSG